MGDLNELFENCRLFAIVNGHLNRWGREVIENQKHSNKYYKKKGTLKVNQIWQVIRERARSLPLGVSKATGAEEAQASPRSSPSLSTPHRLPS